MKEIEEAKAAEETKVEEESKLADEASTQEPEERNPAEETKVDQDETVEKDQSKTAEEASFQDVKEGTDLIDLGDFNSSEVVETSQAPGQAEETKTGILIETIEEEDSLSMDGINVKVCLLTLWYKGTYVLVHQ